MSQNFTDNPHIKPRSHLNWRLAGMPDFYKLPDMVDQEKIGRQDYILRGPPDVLMKPGQRPHVTHRIH